MRRKIVDIFEQHFKLRVPDAAVDSVLLFEAEDNTEDDSNYKNEEKQSYPFTDFIKEHIISAIDTRYLRGKTAYYYAKTDMTKAILYELFSVVPSTYTQTTSKPLKTEIVKMLKTLVKVKKEPNEVVKDTIETIPLKLNLKSKFKVKVPIFKFFVDKYPPITFYANANIVFSLTDTATLVEYIDKKYLCNIAVEIKPVDITFSDRSTEEIQDAIEVYKLAYTTYSSRKKEHEDYVTQQAQLKLARDEQKRAQKVEQLNVKIADVLYNSSILPEVLDILNAQDTINEYTVIIDKNYFDNVFYTFVEANIEDRNRRNDKATFRVKADTKQKSKRLTPTALHQLAVNIVAGRTITKSSEQNIIFNVMLSRLRELAVFLAATDTVVKTENATISSDEIKTLLENYAVAFKNTSLTITRTIELNDAQIKLLDNYNKTKNKSDLINLTKQLQTIVSKDIARYARKLVMDSYLVALGTFLHETNLPSGENFTVNDLKDKQNNET